MKKMFPIVLALFFLYGFSACRNISQNGALSENHLEFAFSPYIGMHKEDALRAMDLTADDLIQSQLQGKYDEENAVVFYDIPFTSYFLFGKWGDIDDCLYGGGYEYISENADEQLLAVLRDLVAQMTERYGEPSTYPTMAYRFENLQEISDLSPGTYFMETWNASEQTVPEGEVSIDAREVFVRIENVDGRFHITVQYQVTNPRLQKNPG